MVLLVDNYDSFTFNIYQAIKRLGFEVVVRRSDKLSIEDILKLNPSHIVLGPGPNSPSEVPFCTEVIHSLKGKYPILGICLGHECLLHAFGAPIVNADFILHGKLSKLSHDGKGLFASLSQGVEVARYHSLVAKEKDVPECFTITARSEDGEVMAISHKDYPLLGLQFHPESIGTALGEKMLLNFFNHKSKHLDIKVLLGKLVRLQDLDSKTSFTLMEEITNGSLDDIEVSSIATSYAIKKPTSTELTGFALALKEKALKFEVPKKSDMVFDIVGTGGSTYKTFNVSSASSLVLASMGVPVIKHGNVAVTSKSGSADVLSRLGIDIDMSLEVSKECFSKLNLTFLFAPNFHKALRHVKTVRNTLGFRTIFNLLGPLCNPASPTHILLGTSDSTLTETLANTLKALGVKRALVVSGESGYDEFSISEDTKVSELKDDKVSTYIFNPKTELGIDYISYESLKGGDSKENAQIIKDILESKDDSKTKERTKLVALNVGASLYICDKAQSIKEGYILALEYIKTKKALQTLKHFIELSQTKN
ncbi:bifunctional anthranilate synthase component II/anthranilate phosphoribosyltransferase [Helicobacter sp. 11S02629-2]|uniref:bifunctional anthranilate synthase component II/anthranilate phosphoribosyltransferase n=1 Tax=Helicobacter sp. 11S02629-2 TaxID=1476195 RepID=UPI000BA51BDE|nr:bifunctional anthranilate synthase component II/anthranilate phosphoribosyltransferase [Helicobacter sp. 11S02629-2]PAF44598.1 anthranilate phosphoribosyltransferase [Helicobacter sp. 11S02629-2]